METARRIYLYALSAIGLGLTMTGLTMLVRSALISLDDALRGPASVVSPDDFSREQLSLAVPLVGVGFVMWLVHWGLAEALVRRAGDSADPERRSLIRALYLSVVMTITIWIAAASMADAIGMLLREWARGSQTFGADVHFPLATAFVAFVAWTYHARARNRDLAAGPLDGAAAWLSRLYLYGISFAGLSVVLYAAMSVIDTLLSLLVGRPGLAVDAVDWWVSPITAAAAQALVGSLLWASHWRYACRLVEAPDWRGVGERASWVRVAYFVGFVLQAVGVVAIAFVAGGSALARAVFGADPADGQTLARDVLGPVLASIPFVAAWWWHRRLAIGEAQEYGGEPRRRSAIRLVDLVTAAIGLACVGTASAWLLGILIDALLGGSRTVGTADEPWGREAAQFVALMAVGLPLWVWTWTRSQARRVVDAVTEAASAARRGYLLLAMGSAVVAAGASPAFLLYPGIRVLFGLSTESLATDVGAALGIAVVGAIVLAYHAMILRTDDAVRARELAGVPAAGVVIGAPTIGVGPAAPALEVPGGHGIAPAEPGAPAPVLAPHGDGTLPSLAAETASGDSASVEELVISGPPGADFDTVNAALAARLPAGYQLHVRPVAHG